MKTFLWKILIIAIPICILLIGVEILNRKNDSSSTYFQKKFLVENQDKIEGVLFGPSHIWRSIHPNYLNHNVASLALSSSSPNIDYFLYEFTKEIIKPKFLVFDLSKGYLSKHSSTDWLKSRNLPYYFPNMRSKEIEDLLLIGIPLKKHISFEEKQTKYDKWGFDKTTLTKGIFKQLNYSDSLIQIDPKIDSFLEKHMNFSNTQKDTEINIGIYKKIIKESINKNIKVIFINPPKYYLYNEKINKLNFSKRDAFLNEVIDNENVYFLNYESFNERNTKLFLNLNHLNIDGAIIFSKKINKDLNSILAK